MNPRFIHLTDRATRRCVRLDAARIAVVRDDGDDGCTLTLSIGERIIVAERWAVVAPLHLPPMRDDENLFPVTARLPSRPQRRDKVTAAPPPDDEDLFQ